MNLGYYARAIAGPLCFVTIAFSISGCAAGLPTAATPTFSPAGGTFTSAQTVSISDATIGASIVYGINGAPNTAPYVGPITVSSSERLTAIATANGYNTSLPGSASFTISVPTAATPTFSPAGGTFTSAQTVSISDATIGASIVYGINGAPNTAPYVGPITVSSSETLTAIATANGYNTSLPGSASFTISVPTAATPTFSPAGGIYLPMRTVAISDSTPGAKIYYGINGAPTTTTYGGPITISSSESLTAIATATGYNNSLPGSASYTIYGTTDLLPGTIYWGADGHRDKTGPYTNASLPQQIADLQRIFKSGPNSIFYRAWDDIVACGCASDITTLQSAGIIPLVGVITYPDSDPPCGGINPGWNNFISHPASGMTPEQTAYTWAYCTASLAVAAAPTNMFWYVGNTDDWAGSYPITGQCLNDGMAASDWNSSSVTSYPVYRGALAGAIKAIRDFNLSAKIIQGASGWSVGLSAALANDLRAYNVNGKSWNLLWDFSSAHWATDVASGTQYWNCNHGQYSGTISFPDNFYDQPKSKMINIFSLNFGSGTPLFFDEFSSGNGQKSINDVEAGIATIRLMNNLLSHSIATTAERGVVGATYYELYQDGSTAGADRYLYFGPGNIAPQGTAVSNWIGSSQNPSTQNPSTNSGPKFSVAGTPVTISSPGATTSNSSTVTITPQNGFTGTVSLACEVWSSSPNSYIQTTPSCSVASAVTISGTSSVSTTLMVLTPSAPPGPYVVTLTAVGGGALTSTTIQVALN